MAYLRKPLSTWTRPEHQRRLEPGALALVPERLEELDARRVLGLAALAAARSSRRASAGRPAAPRCVSKLGFGRRRVGDRRRQRRAHRVGQRLFDLRAGPRRAAGTQRRRAACATQRRGAATCAHAREPAPSRAPAASASGTLAALRASRRPWYFELAVLQAAVGDDHAVRHADQLPVGEHRAGALAAVVEHDVDAERRELVVQRVGGARAPRRAVVADRADARPRTARSASGQMMPRSSWFCSIAAPRMRVTPMP